MRLAQMGNGVLAHATVNTLLDRKDLSNFTLNAAFLADPRNRFLLSDFPIHLLRATFVQKRSDTTQKKEEKQLLQSENNKRLEIEKKSCCCCLGFLGSFVSWTWCHLSRWQKWTGIWRRYSSNDGEELPRCGQLVISQIQWTVSLNDFFSVSFYKHIYFGFWFSWNTAIHMHPHTSLCLHVRESVLWQPRPECSVDLTEPKRNGLNVFKRAAWEALLVQSP